MPGVLRKTSSLNTFLRLPFTSTVSTSVTSVAASRPSLTQHDISRTSAENKLDTKLIGIPVLDVAHSEERIIPIIPLSPIGREPKARVWGEEWTHPVNMTVSKKKIGLSSVGISSVDKIVSPSSTGSSNLSNNSSNYSSTLCSNCSKHPVLSKTVLPSSSISSVSRRLPLAKMKSTEAPDIGVESEVRFRTPKPSTTSPTYKWSQASHNVMLSQLLPAAEFDVLQRQVSATLSVDSSQSDILSKTDLPFIPRKAVPPSSRSYPAYKPDIIRETNDFNIPGAFLDYEYQTSLEHERTTEEHVQTIEAEYDSHAPSHRNQAPTSSGAGDIELGDVINPVDLRSRYRERRLSSPRNKTDAVLVVAHSDGLQNAKNERVKKLILGDISADWDLSRIGEIV